MTGLMRSRNIPMQLLQVERRDNCNYSFNQRKRQKERNEVIEKKSRNRIGDNILQQMVVEIRDNCNYSGDKRLDNHVPSDAERKKKFQE